MRMAILLAAAALAAASCGHLPIGKIQDHRLDPGAPRPNASDARPR